MHTSPSHDPAGFIERIEEAAAEQKTLKTTARAEASSSFNEASYPVDITPEEREVGILSYHYFAQTLKRVSPWIIKNGKITVTKRFLAPTELEQNPEFPQLPALHSREIITDGIENEEISGILASVMFTFKRIEDKLPDFTGRSYNLFRNLWGINRSYHQWGQEEGQHSDALGLIITRTGHMTQEEIEDDYYENLAKTWEMPFPTPRQMALYAAFQEQLTSLNYHALASRALEEGAKVVAEIMKLIAHDEAYHGGGYRAFSRIFASVDMEGTIADALHVAMNFRMPAQHLMRNLKRDSIDIVRVGAFSKEMVSEETIYRVLKGLGFVPEALAREAANTYWRK